MKFGSLNASIARRVWPLVRLVSSLVLSLMETLMLTASLVSVAAPPCSFYIQQGKQIHRPRESIEVRYLVFYEGENQV
jgi:hypothetical protein